MERVEGGRNKMAIKEIIYFKEEQDKDKKRFSNREIEKLESKLGIKFPESYCVGLSFVLKDNELRRKKVCWFFGKYEKIIKVAGVFFHNKTKKYPEEIHFCFYNKKEFDKLKEVLDRSKYRVVITILGEKK